MASLRPGELESLGKWRGGGVEGGGRMCANTA